MNCSTGIILSVKTRSEQQVSKLKQANLKLATRVEQLEHSCLEKVKEKNTFNLGLPAQGDPCARLALLAWFPHPGLEQHSPACASLGCSSSEEWCPYLCPTSFGQVVLFSCSRRYIIAVGRSLGTWEAACRLLMIWILCLLQEQEIERLNNILKQHGLLSQQK